MDLIIELEDKTKIGIEMNTNANRHLIDRNLYYIFRITKKDNKRR